MASFTWTSTAAGSWVSPVFWTVGGAATGLSPGSAAGNTDSATIAAAGTATILAPVYPDLVNLALTDPGAVLAVQGGLAVEGDVSNAGTIRLAAGAVMTAGNLGEPSFGAFANTGLIDVGSGAVFSLFAPTTTASLGAFARDSGAIVIAGQINNAGATIAAADYANIDLAGGLAGGTIVDDAASLRIVDQVPQGDGYPAAVTFTGVTFQGALAPLGPLSLTGGFTLEPLAPATRETIDLTGTATVAGLPPLHAAITALDAETLDNVTILLGDLQAATTITLGAGATLANSGTGFLGGAGSFLSGATITNTGFLAINNAGTFANAGLLTNAGGTVTDDNGGALVNTGSIVLAGGHFTAPAAGTGTIELTGGATAELTGPYGSQSFRFADAVSFLRLDHVGGTNEVLGFQPGDTIELTSTEAAIAFAGGTLSLSNANLAIGAFLMPDQPANAQFHATIDANADTLITDTTASSADTIITETIPCFAAGTRIATPSGPCRVEDLRVGQAVLLADGGTAPIVWLGHRRLACVRHPRPWDVLPIRVQAHAFAPGQPTRDLRLSPDHAVLWDGVLVPVRALMNGRTIRQEPSARITYWHIELPAHRVMLAEGLPCESYLDTGNRGAFSNAGPALQLHPDFARGVWAAHGCAPLVLGGLHLVAIRRHLLVRAMQLGHWITDDPALRLSAGGQKLQAAVAGATWRVRIPPDAASLRLVSRAWIPAETRLADTDTRRLGVALTDFRLDGETLPLDDPRLGAGWHEPESGWRWTDGDALLALPTGGELAFTLKFTGSYWQAADPQTPRRRTRHVR